MDWIQCVYGPGSRTEALCQRRSSPPGPAATAFAGDGFAVVSAGTSGLLLGFPFIS